MHLSLFKIIVSRTCINRRLVKLGGIYLFGFSIEMIRHRVHGRSQEEYLLYLYLYRYKRGLPVTWAIQRKTL